MGLCQAMRNETFFGEGLQTKIDMFYYTAWVNKNTSRGNGKIQDKFSTFQVFPFLFRHSCGA